MKKHSFQYLRYLCCLFMHNAVSLCCTCPTDNQDDSDIPDDSSETLQGGISMEMTSQDFFGGFNWNQVEKMWISYRGSCAFTKFNRQVKPHGADMVLLGISYDAGYVEQFMKQASIEERKNSDQVIVYHGEPMGIWLLQVLAKKLKYPHAKEWLPLRFGQDSADADAKTLQNVIQSTKSTYIFKDHAPEFTAIGTAAHVNLMSKDPFESAACAFDDLHWDAFCGTNSKSSQNPLKSFFESFKIPTHKHNEFLEQFNTILQIIGWKLKWRPVCRKDQEIDLQKAFSTLIQNDIELIESWRDSNGDCVEEIKKGVGVILQITMSPEVASKYSYASGIFGRIKDKPFLEYYKNHKNKLDDDGQLRIAMGHPFTRYPSPVKIKALSPIFQEEDLIQMLKKMLRHIVTLIKTDYKGFFASSSITRNPFTKSQ